MPTFFFSFLLLVLFVDILEVILLPIALSQCAVIPFILVAAVSLRWVARVIVAMKLVTCKLVSHLVKIRVCANVVVHTMSANM